MNFVDIVFASFLANNLLFFHFLGLREFLGEQRTHRTVLLCLLLLVAAAAYWLPEQFIIQAFHWEFLRTAFLGLVMWLVTSLYSLVRREGWPHPRELLVHSLLVGGVLLVGARTDLFEMLTAALAVGLGYGVALVLLSSVFSRLSRETVPALVQGLPLQLITLGLVWLVLQGLGLAFAGKAS